MKFGDESTFALIGQALDNPHNSAEFTQVCAIVYNDVRVLINKYCRGLQPVDKEDLEQEIVSKVIIKLNAFYEESADCSAVSRNSWLKKVVLSTRNDYFRRRSRSFLSEECEYNDALCSVAGKDIHEELEKRMQALEILKTAFELNTTADKLIAFVYNKMLIRANGVNGAPGEIEEEFQNCTIQQMYDAMVIDLSAAIGQPISEEILRPLKTKVEKDPNQLFTMSSIRIADTSNWVVKKIKGALQND